MNVTDTASMPTEPAECRPMRADARRNRERVVKAAREVFAQYGREAGMDDVAKRAKVGVGTVYRHFPTKEALFAALIEDKFVRLKATACEYAATDDPGQAFYDVMWAFARQMAADRTLHDVLRDYPHREHALRVGLYDEMSAFIARAKAAGAVREDFTADDIPALMCAAGAVMVMHGAEEERFERYYALALDGLRPRVAA